MPQNIAATSFRQPVAYIEPIPTPGNDGLLARIGDAVRSILCFIASVITCPIKMLCSPCRSDDTIHHHQQPVLRSQQTPYYVQEQAPQHPGFFQRLGNVFSQAHAPMARVPMAQRARAHVPMAHVPAGQGQMAHVPVGGGAMPVLRQAPHYSQQQAVMPQGHGPMGYGAAGGGVVPGAGHVAVGGGAMPVLRQGYNEQGAAHVSSYRGQGGYPAHVPVGRGAL